MVLLLGSPADGRDEERELTAGSLSRGGIRLASVRGRSGLALETVLGEGGKSGGRGGGGLVGGGRVLGVGVVREGRERLGLDELVRDDLQEFLDAGHDQVEELHGLVDGVTADGRREVVGGDGIEMAGEHRATKGDATLGEEILGTVGDVVGEVGEGEKDGVETVDEDRGDRTEGVDVMGERGLAHESQRGEDGGEGLLEVEVESRGGRDGAVAEDAGGPGAEGEGGGGGLATDGGSVAPGPAAGGCFTRESGLSHGDRRGRGRVRCYISPGPHPEEALCRGWVEGRPQWAVHRAKRA